MAWDRVDYWGSSREWYIGMSEYWRNFAKTSVMVGALLLVVRFGLVSARRGDSQPTQIPPVVTTHGQSVKDYIRAHDPAFVTTRAATRAVVGKPKSVPPVITGGDPWGRQW